MSTEIPTDAVTLTEASGFRAAICAQPTDDTVRHAYADWLDRYGQETYAEFIRMQLSRASLRPNVRQPDSSPYRIKMLFESLPQLRDPEPGILRGVVNGDWSALAAAILDLAPACAIYDRGFVATIYAPWRLWRDRWHRWAWHPTYCAYPYSDGAHPVTTVALIDRPEVSFTTSPEGYWTKLDGFNWQRTARGLSHEEVIDHLLQQQWPWLTFRYPTITT